MIELIRVDDAFLFEATNERGYKLQIDASPKIGGGNTGYRPMELLLAGAAGCSGIDMVNILRKQKATINSMEISVKGERAEAVPAVFTHIHLDYYLTGDFSEEKAQRAADLSVNKYCSAIATMNQVAEISYAVHLHKREERNPA